MTPQDFPTLRAGARNADRFDTTIEDIAAAIEAGSIRNVALQDAKFDLSRALERAWESTIQAPHFHGKADAIDPEVSALYWSISLMSLHDVIATSKKLDRTKATGEAVEAMRRFIREVLPLAQAVHALKDRVVKGRAPNSGPSKPENPNKRVRTCGVCFRPIAVLRGTMAHHGYERPGTGWQTASCAGIRFKPLEVSPEGLDWLIEMVASSLATAERAFAERDNLQQLPVRRGLKVEVIDRTSKDWTHEFDRHARSLEREIESLTLELPRLRNMRAQWTQKEAE